MRLALVLIALTAAAANAAAQPASPPPASPPAPAASATTPPPASAATPPAPSSSAPAPAAPSSETPTAPAAAPPPAEPASLPPLPETPPTPVMPATPPPPPTDPTAVAVLSVLTNVCIPAANGGNLPQLAKTNGFRKSGYTWTLRQSAFSLTIEDPGTNPNQCHVDVVHPVDQDAPGREIVVALHNWAELTNGWSLYRNDKSVQEGFEYTTRSWDKDANGKSESLVFTTQRHPDGTPMQHSSDTSQLIYGQSKDPAS
jgi:hypothetical protein